MTPGWLVTAEDGRHWNLCLGTTGGHRCQGMLAGMSPPVTCASGPNHSESSLAGFYPFLLDPLLGALSCCIYVYIYV